MIPILYAKETTDFNNNGIGFLRDAVKALVTEERNGSYELSLQYPVTGQWYVQIGEGCIIKAKANETSEPQLFRIYKSSKPLKGMVTYSAEHISYDLGGIPTRNTSLKSATPLMAMQRAVDNAALPCDFTMYSDISALNDISIPTPCSIRAVLGGQSGSILDVWGGEFEFDNFTVKLHENRGADNGVSIAYGKNLTDLKQERNISECYTHLMPYAKYSADGDDGESEEIYVYLSESVIPLAIAENIGHYKACIMDFSDRFELEDGETITEDMLREVATAYAETAEIGVPQINITVSFVQLWQTEEYKNIAPLERVKLCDTVTVHFPALGVKASAKVIKTVYDTLKEKYNSVTLGDAKSTLADTISGQKAELESLILKGNAQASEALKKAILNATNLITGQAGGYVVLTPAEKPQEILIMDAPTIADAKKVWRWNSSGLGYSSTGYNGEYALAMTMDGAIVASFITAGTLNGALLQADSVQSSAISASYKKEVTDALGNVESSVTQAFKASDEELLSQITAQIGDFATSSEIKQLSDKISLVVTSTSSGDEIDSASIIAAINGDSSTLTLDAEKIDLSGYVSFLSLSTEGQTNINGGNVTSGTISADRINTEKLMCTALYAKGHAQGYHVALNGGLGDFGIFNSQNTNLDPAESTCIFGVRHDIPAVNFFCNGVNFMGFNTEVSNTLFPKGNWDFTNASVTGLVVTDAVAVFGE